MATLNTSAYSTIARAFILWAFANLGGTLWLLLDFSLERVDDYPVALLTGLVAALVSLCIVPLVIPFFSLMCHLQVGLSRRSLALIGVTLFFLLANKLLELLLPINSVHDLLSMSLPYWAAAMLTVLWLYSPGQRESTNRTTACD
ncbi:hypothetical protein HNQ93_000277 [Hymenobacter luteus]|uniref:Uncharacterized protein n=2 Tax=Hymenobacter TaxID=89966 RepID=A0A7W9SX07_9BACT|nr:MULTISPECIES: hypothetical protein [Hymenobacter]MBB4600243.1 hypothetical protein [Hymenobacter latericoloratus]MBB6057447.1 hypothetical protein [Hymenobacter luteus]